MKIIEYFAILFLGAVFILSAIGKILDPELFFQDVLDYRIFPRVIAIAGVLFLPWLEFFSGLGLFIPYLRKESALIIAALNIFFIIIVSIALAKGAKSSCGCFGPFSEEISFSLIIRDFVFLITSIFIYLRT